MKRINIFLTIVLMMTIVGSSYARDTKAYESLMHEKNELTSRLSELELIQQDLDLVCNSKNFKKRISAIKRAMYIFGSDLKKVFPDFNKTLMSLNNYFDLYIKINNIENKLYEFQQNFSVNEETYHAMLVDRRVLVDRFDILRYTLCGELKSTIDKYLAFTNEQIQEIRNDITSIDRQVSIYEQQSISLND